MILDTETDFGLNLLRLQHVNETGVFSPMSVVLALSLVHMGARGKTEKQLSKLIGGDETPRRITDHYSYVFRTFEDSSVANLSVATKFYIRQGTDIKKEFFAKLDKKFESTTERLDFNKQELAAKTVNDFVKNKTYGKISDIVTPSSFDEGNDAVLINTVYFAAPWEKKFVKAETKKGTFHHCSGTNKEVDFMHSMHRSHNYGADADMRILQLRYIDKRFALNIILPTKRFGLQNVIEKLTADRLFAVYASMQRVDVNVKLPRFKVSSSLKLEKDLATLGATDLSDLSAINGRFKLGPIAHKTYFEVNEYGTVAAAATTAQLIYLDASMIIGETIDFEADQPFLFVLSKNNRTVFLGTYN